MFCFFFIDTVATAAPLKQASTDAQHNIYQLLFQIHINHCLHWHKFDPPPSTYLQRNHFSLKACLHVTPVISFFPNRVEEYQEKTQGVEFLLN